MNSCHWLRSWSRGQLWVVVLAQIGSLLFGTTSAVANPLGGTVVGGAAAIQSAGKTLAVKQSTDRAVINWQGFSINKGEVTKFIQPGSNSAVLNRVTCGNPSALLGSLQANGKVYLINPNGILVGPGANINVGAFTASTLDVDPKQFMRGGDVRFQGDSKASVVNFGQIHAIEGDVYLIGAHVANHGTILAPNGVAGLVAARDVTLVDSAHPQLVVRPSAESLGGTGVTNTGTIEAIHARLIAASGNVYALAINNTGRVTADGAKLEGGKVLLVANGGKIETSGELVAKNGVNGGQVTVDAGAGGSAVVSGKVQASGSDADKTSVGGKVQITGENIQLNAATIEASGSAAGGTVLVGGGTHGGDSTVLNAVNTSVDASSAIRTDAQTNGNGGKVAVWADDVTNFSGTISARGGSLGGDGGFVEVSGKNTLNFSGTVNTLAPHGAVGTLLMDPADYTIDSSNVAAIISNLTTTNVTIETGSAGAGNGDIFVNTAIGWSAGTTLTLNAYRNINVNAAITNTGSGSVTLRADSTGISVGTVSFGSGGSISLNTGSANILYNPTNYASLADRL